MAPPPPAFRPVVPGSVSVVVTVLKDPRVARTLESLLHQTRPPDEVLVDDGGGNDDVRRLTEAFTQRDPRVRHLDAPGNIPESRNIALLAATGEFVAFLDADEVAPPGGSTPWCARSATRPSGSPADRPPRWPERPVRSGRDTTTAICAGSTRPLRGPILTRSRWGTRPGARRSSGGSASSTLPCHRGRRARTRRWRSAPSPPGWKGLFVPEAWVDHDFSDITTWGLLRKQRIYAEGGFVVWRRRGTTYEASPGASRRTWCSPRPRSSAPFCSCFR